MTAVRNELLVVDDDQVFADTLARTLSSRGYQVEQSYDVASAAKLISQTPYAYAVVDLKIGEESGLEIVQQLKQTRPDCVTVVLTGYASITTAVEAIKLGATQYLMKPVELDELCEALEGEESIIETAQQEEPMSIKRLEWEHIQRVLNEHDGNISAAARSLNMHRRTLQRKLQKRPVRR